MSETDRDDSGRFTESVTEQDILKAFDRADAPFLTASELGEELGLSRQAANYRLKKMRENGLLIGNRREHGQRDGGLKWLRVSPLKLAGGRMLLSVRMLFRRMMKRRFGMDG